MITVVIPVYNCGRYLERCFNSLKNQTLSDFEVIAVDNGSTDNSKEIAEKYSKSDKRFISISHNSGSAGECRNVGISMAKGEFISFIDADDWVEREFLKKLYDCAIENNADIAVCGFNFYFMNTEKTEKCSPLPKDTVYDREKAIKILLLDREMRFYLWNKLWKKTLFTDNSIKIPNMYYEDAAVCPQLYFYAEKVASVSYCGYNYVRAFSKYKEIKMTSQRINDYINTIPIIRGFFEENGCYKKYKGAFRTHISHVLFSLPSLCMQAKETNKDSVLINSFRGIKKVIICSTVSAEKLKNIDYKTDAVK